MLTPLSDIRSSPDKGKEEAEKFFEETAELIELNVLLMKFS